MRPRRGGNLGKHQQQRCRHRRGHRGWIVMVVVKRMMLIDVMRVVKRMMVVVMVVAKRLMMLERAMTRVLLLTAGDLRQPPVVMEVAKRMMMLERVM